VKRALALALVLLAPVAHAAPTKEECVAADTQAQDLRREGKLHEALTQLDVCTNPACADIVRADCSERVEDIKRVIPTVVFDVKTSSGVDVADVRVEMDGHVLRDKIDGLPVSIDPGEHTFVLTSRGASKTIQLLAHEGDKDRRVTMTVAEAVSTPPATPSSGGAQRAVGVVLGGTGLLGLALGVTFGSVAIAEHGQVTSTCPNNVCPTEDARNSVLSENSDTQTFATASTVAFIAGAVLAAAGVVLYVTAPRARVTVGLGVVTGVF